MVGSSQNHISVIIDIVCICYLRRIVIDLMNLNLTKANLVFLQLILKASISRGSRLIEFISVVIRV